MDNISVCENLQISGNCDLSLLVCHDQFYITFLKFQLILFLLIYIGTKLLSELMLKYC